MHKQKFTEHMQSNYLLKNGRGTVERHFKKCMGASQCFLIKTFKISWYLNSICFLVMETNKPLSELLCHDGLEEVLKVDKWKMHTCKWIEINFRILTSFSLSLLFPLN